MPFVGGKQVAGTPISWDQSVSGGDPHALDDGFEHYIVTFAGLGEHPTQNVQDASVVLVEQTTSHALPGPEATDEPGVGKAVRLVPLQKDANGEISAEDLKVAAAQGILRRIVSDGSSIFAEVEAGVTSDARDVSQPTTTTTAKSAEHESSGHESGDQDSVTGDPLAAVLKQVPGTKKVSLVMAGVYAVTTKAKAEAFEALPGVADVDEDVVLTVSTNDPQY
ncbi:MAG: hypothetical protein WA797_10840, partial [Acidimicrobiales bacterium]